MKSSRFLPSIFTISASAMSLGFAELPDDGLVAHWGLEGTFFNEQGDGALDGSAPNGLSFSEDVPCETAGLMSGLFDGVNDSVRIDSPVLADYDADYTISAWFRADDAPSGSTRYVVYESDQFVISLGLRQGSPASNTNVQFFTNTTVTNDPQISVQVPDSLVAGKWIHACLVYRNDEGNRSMSAYLDGIHRQTLAIADPLDLSPNPSFFNIGTYRGANGRWFKGLIDDVAIWDRALTPAEVAGLAIPALPAEISPLFQIQAEDEIRVDFVTDWFGSHGSSVADGTDFDTTPNRGKVIVESLDGSLNIHNTAGLSIPGPNLEHRGGGPLRLHLRTDVQGFGIAMEAMNTVAPDCLVSFYTCNGALLGSFTVSPTNASDNEVFLGVIDPAARIGIIELSTSGGEAFAISAPKFQLPRTVPRLADLPVASSITMRVQNNVTYLHEGRQSFGSTPATADASEDNKNTCDLGEDFPGLRAGDIIAFQRQGYALKSGRSVAVLGVFSESEVILEGTAQRRLPDALDAGIDYRTSPTRSKSSSISTATNIPEDFVISSLSFISVPDRANFAMLSLAEPSPELSPVDVKLSHIPREIFLDWVASYGLHGPLAELDHDFDGDGLTLIEEFAFGRDPLVADSGSESDAAFAFAPQTFEGVDGGLQLTFGARTHAPLRYGVQFSDDLDHWTPAPFSPLRVDGFGSRALFRAVDPAGSATQRFGRVSIEYIPPGP